ncbi:MAG: DUF799 domain-containing protein [Burkholderiaceae bacterium]
MIRTAVATILFPLALLAGCAVDNPYDYSAFKAANPRSILVLPPTNSSPEVNASYSFYSHTQRPLAESGYYVLPITLVDEVFKANGLPVPDEMHKVDPARLRKIFGADAAMYIDINDYGTRYFVIGSASVVTAQARLVDLRTGALLWEGRASASSSEQQNNQGGLAGLLITAIVRQVAATALDESHGVARITSARLLSAGRDNGMLYGPLSPNYKP